MKALVIFKRQGENQLRAYFIDEKKIRNELSSLKEHGEDSNLQKKEKGRFSKNCCG